ncbi:MAG TPA: hypothetical protein VHG51_13950 [Longimicrobiaceae bacterium]|nr:hypothetical protein [Longimicrobiaceae bacterium]
MAPVDGRARVDEALAALLPGRAPALPIDRVVELARALLERLGVAAGVWEDRLGVRTVRYYRSKGIVSAPAGEGPNARYGRRHVLEAAVARLAGHLHHLSLADAAERIASLDEAGLAGLLAELAERQAEDDGPRTPPGAAPARPLSPAGERGIAAAPSVTLLLPHGALLVLPADHPALARAPAEGVGRIVAATLESAAATE